MINLIEPTHIGPYQVQSLLRSDLYSSVFRGSDPLAKRSVILRVFFIEPEDAPEQFMVEARILTLLQHKNIIQTFELGTTLSDDDTEYLYIAEQEYTEPTLYQRLNQNVLPVDEALSVIRKLASALDYMHRHGVVHRDFQPRTIIVSEQNEPLIYEFGLTRLLTSADQTVEPGFGLTQSTYLAPEQIIGENLASPLTDQYALALVAFQLLTGQMPFKAHKLRDIINERLYSKPIQASSVRPTLGSAVDSVFVHAFNRVPALRYPSAMIFADELTNTLKAAAVRAADPSPQGTVDSPQRPLLRRLFNPSRS